MTDERAEPEYAGLVTRTIAFAIDAAIINLVAIAVAGTIALGLSILSVPDKHKELLAAIAGVVFAAWTIGYFVVFWSTTGQTPGNRVMHIRVLRSDLEPVRPVQAGRRWVGVIVAALPLFTGFLLILVNDRRRGLQDRIAGTVVISTPPEDVIRPPRPAPVRAHHGADAASR